MRRRLLISALFLTAFAHAQIASSAFGGQCPNNTPPPGGYGCNSSGTYVPPPSPYAPGLIRMWDTGTYWSVLEPSNGTFSFHDLDEYIDGVASQFGCTHGVPCNGAPLFLFTFGGVPSWIASSSTGCGTKGCPAPPSDCTPLSTCASGSAAFHNFVTTLIGRTTAGGNSVAAWIKFFEMWNEATNSSYWTGTANALYGMVQPEEVTIRSNVSGVKLLDPSITNSSGFQTFQCAYMANEVANNYFGDYFDPHPYWTNGTSNRTPEQEIVNGTFTTWISINANYSTACSPNPGTWTPLPLVFSEFSFQSGAGSTPYQCDLTKYTAADCAGMIVRWQLLTMANYNVVSDVWYSGVKGIGITPLYATAYYYSQQYLTGGTLGTCANTTNVSGNVWICPFTESGGKVAEFVWTVCETASSSGCSSADLSYTVPSGLTRYKNLAGGVIGVTPGSNVTISVEPVMFEQINPGVGAQINGKAQIRDAQIL